VVGKLHVTVLMTDCISTTHTLLKRPPQAAGCRLQGIQVNLSQHPAVTVAQRHNSICGLNLNFSQQPA
jgi:hypothetical protein